jgi:hypothetical protein
MTVVASTTIPPILAQPAQLPTRSAQKAAKTNPKRGHVWTNDDLSSLRSPADVDAEQKISTNQSAPAPFSSGPPKDKSSGTGNSSQQGIAENSLPNDVDAVQALIKKSQEDIVRKQKVVDDAVIAAGEANSSLERSALESNVEIANVDLGFSRDELKLLQAKLAELKAKAGSGTHEDSSRKAPESP